MHVQHRELAQQVADSCSSLRKLYKLRVACVVGGSDRAAQAQSLAGKPNIIVATPGRLIDLADSADSALSKSHVCLSTCLSRLAACCTYAVYKVRCLLCPCGIYLVKLTLCGR